MKILLLGDPIDNQNAGIHVYTRELAKALARVNRGKHELFLFREKSDDPIEGFSEFSFPNIHYPIGYASFRLFLQLPLKMRGLRPDVVIEPAHFGPFNTPKGAKRVTIIHDLTPILFPEHHRWHSQFLQKVFLKGILKRADWILANSAYTRDDVKKHYPFTKKKVDFIYPGANPNIRYTDKKPQSVSGDYFLYVGTIEPRKQISALLEMYQLWRTKGLGNQKLVIAGAWGWKSDGVKQAVNDHPFKADIITPGFVPDEELASLYSHTDLFIYPSLYEGFGFPVLEAIRCKAKVLCSNNSSLPEVGGDLVNYISSTDPETFALDVRNALSKEKADYSTRINRFSWDNMAFDLLYRLEGL